jgi:hypothetical protein
VQLGALPLGDYGGPVAPTHDVVKVNGYPVPSMLISQFPEGTAVLPVPIEYLRFARREEGQISTSVLNGQVNVVTVETNLSQFRPLPSGQPMCGGEWRIVSFGPAWIEFDTLAPILMVHWSN